MHARTHAGRIVLAGLLFGLAVHWRVYPIIYALPILRHLALKHQQQPKQQQQPQEQPRRGALVAGLASPRGLVFGAVSGGLFLALAALFHRAYGPAFLHESYLYHASRSDPRHNFSSYFYPAYLATAEGAATGADVGG